MDLAQLLRELSTHKKNFQSAVKLLKDISRLEKERTENLPKLRVRLTKLDEIIKRLDQGMDQIHNIRSWIDQYERDLDATEAQVQKRFGVELEQELKKLRITLSGQYPNLKAGLFTIELDFRKWRATLWYGPKQERLDQCDLSVVEVAKQIDKAKQQLGSQLSEEEFLKKLHEAYRRSLVLASKNLGESMPILEVLSELAHLLQSPRFHQDPKREKYRGYSRYDFSYDLFRVRRSGLRTLGETIRLIVATRAHTKRRQDFLWVPDDETGKGTMYSHLQFKEATS